MSQHVKQLTDANFAEEVLGQAQPVLVDFWAEWCAPCRTLGPIVEQLAADYDGRLKVGKLNIDEHPDTPAKHQITALPTLVLFQGGKVVDTQVGLVKKAQLAAFVDKHL